MKAMRPFLMLVLAIAASVSRLGSAGAPTPVVVELFTSEGCSSCPAADALLQRLLDTQPVPDVQIIALGHHVDYWDQLGWRDRFSSGASTNRQQRYAQIFNIDSVYTPEMVVDGREEFVGSDARAAQRAIAQAAAAPHADVSLAAEPAAGGHVAVAVKVAGVPKLSGRDHADVVLAVTESGLRSDVRGGENRGRQLAHAPVVRQLTTIGEARSDAALRTDVAVPAAWQRDRVTIVAFVQERFGRHVLGAAALPLQSTTR